MSAGNDRQIAEIEALAANAVPAAVMQELDGWLLRYNHGVTRRANSTLAPRQGSRLTLAERLDQCEAFYRSYHAPARFQLCPVSQPPDLDVILAERGYQLDTATNVQTCLISTLLRASTNDQPVASGFSEGWLAAYIEGEGERDPAKIACRRAMLTRIGPPAGFAARMVDGVVAAVALGVVEHGWLGIFNVATRPAFRRRGLAAAVVTDLAHWGAGLGARSAYLQVFSLNRAALALYRQLGFETAYSYWYRQKNLAP
jgi:ribosomal protein S18 acetylase RimI-like enzyme